MDHGTKKPLATALALVIALTLPSFMGCGDDGGSDSDDGMKDAATSNGSPNLDPKERCEFVLWESPDTDRGVYECVEAQEGWSCDCAGTDASSEVDGCTAAIEDACGVTEPDRGFCEAGPIATCWPADGDDAWTCRCDGEEAALQDATGADCDAAMADACGSVCADDVLGACAEDGAGDGYRCACTFYAPTLRTVRGQDDCEQALQVGCTSNASEPGAHGCNSLAGFCDANGDELHCECLTGDSASFTAADLADKDCPRALGETCGATITYNDTFCSGDQGECRRGNEEGAPVCYECLCKSGTSGMCVEFPDCWDALAAECEAE